jgi:peptidoglycan/LPS O-acetylase OafA/YrhL
VGYQPRLDGIRALAVLAVVGFHATGFMRGGWLGVDIFFALSGYLITTILIRERELSGRINLRMFYLKRVLRLAPALLIAVAISIPLLYMFPGVEAAYPPLAIVAGVIAYVGNWMQMFHPVSLGPLTHTWSLAIEEQFYMFWPLALIAMFALRWTRQRMAIVCAVLIGCLVVLRAVLAWSSGWDGLWFASTSRADALLIGALAAFLAPKLKERTATALVGFTGVLLAVGCFTAREFSSVMLYGGLTVIAATAALFMAAAQQSPFGKFLEWGLLVRLGRVSYGVYLYHYPVFFLVNHSGVTGIAAYAVKAGLTAALVGASWFLAERPALALKDRLAPRLRRDVSPRSQLPQAPGQRVRRAVSR